MDTEQQDIMDVPPGSESPETNEDTDSNPFTEKTVTNNTALIVEGKKLYVSRAVLSLVSPVFRAMFELDMEEKQMDEIPLPGKYLDDVVEFLLCIYPDTRKPITEDNASFLVPLFDEYQLDDRKAHCERVLTASCDVETDIDTLFEHLLMASTYNLKHLKSKCLHLAAEKKSDVLQSTLVDYTLPGDLKAELWEIAAEKKDVEIKSLLTVCRWGGMKPSTCMYNTVQNMTSVTCTEQRKIMGTAAVRAIYTTAIQSAIKHNLNRMVELLTSLYLGELIAMEDGKYQELLNSALPEIVKSSILKKLEANAKK